MFKNMIVYRIAAQWSADLAAMEAALQQHAFVPCGPSQEQSGGWVPPRGEAHGALAESVNGHWILRFQSESKMLPASVLNRKVQEKVDAIEREFGRKPGKKEKRDLKDEAKLDLLPMAFTKQSSIWVWIDPRAQWLVLDTGAQGKADDVVSLLVESLQGFGVALLDTQTSAQAAMAHWLLTQDAPVGFSIDRECELKASDESKAVVRYARHPLDIAEVQQHIQQGKLPTKLAMTWEDRVSFVLADSLQIKKVAWTETVLDQAGDASGFDTDVAIATGELSKLLPDLVEALGGEGRSHGGEPAQTLAVRVASSAVTGPAQAPADNAPDEAPF